MQFCITGFETNFSASARLTFTDRTCSVCCFFFFSSSSSSFFSTVLAPFGNFPLGSSDCFFPREKVGLFYTEIDTPFIWLLSGSNDTLIAETAGRYRFQFAVFTFSVARAVSGSVSRKSLI